MNGIHEASSLGQTMACFSDASLGARHLLFFSFVLLFLPVRWLIYQPGDGGSGNVCRKTSWSDGGVGAGMGGKGSVSRTNGLTLLCWLIRGGSQWSTPGREQLRTASCVISYTRLGSSLPTQWQRSNLCTPNNRDTLFYCTESTSVPAASQTPCITHCQPGSFPCENQKSFLLKLRKKGFYWPSYFRKQNAILLLLTLMFYLVLLRNPELDSINHKNQVQIIVHFQPHSLNKMSSLSN